MIQPIINGQVLDLFGDPRVAVTKQMGLIGDIANRDGDVTVNFTIPYNDRNIEILNNIPGLNILTDSFSFQSFRGKLIDKGLTVSQGYFQLLSVTKDKREIELRFLGGNSDWFERIGGANIAELDYSDLSHLWDVETIIASKDNTEGFVYFMIDNGANQDITDNNFLKTDFNFGVFSLDIFKRIFDNATLKIGGSLLNDNRLRNELVAAIVPVIAAESGDFTSNHTPIRQRLPGVGAGDSAAEVFFPNGDNSADWNGTVFTAASDITELNFFFSWVVEGSQIFTLGTVTVTMEYSGGGDQTAILSMTAIGDVGQTRIYLGEINHAFGPILAGETVTILHQGSQPSSQTTNFLIESYNNEFSQIEIQRVGSDKRVVDVDVFLPEMNQADFVRDIMFRYGYVSQYDANSETVTFNKFDEVDFNKTKAVDWSKGVDLTIEPEINFTEVLEGYSKRNNIGYSEDSDDLVLQLWRLVLKTGLGTGVIDIESDYLTGESDLYISPFSPTGQRLTFPFIIGDSNAANWVMPYMSLYDEELDKPNEINPRVVLSSGSRAISDINRGGFTSINVREEIGGDPTATSSIGWAFFVKTQMRNLMDTDGLDDNTNTLAFEQPNVTYIGVTLLQRGFNLYGKILSKPIMLKIYQKFTPDQIAELDHTIPVFIDFNQDQAYYYVDQVIQYDGENVTEVKLIKI